jgi:hypothetical protein
VVPTIDSSFPLTNYDPVNITEGKLYVNGEVGCNDRISVTGICKNDLPDGTVELCFTYENTSPFTFFIPFGERENQFKFKGNNAIIGGDEPPSVFPANSGPLTICVITNGDDVQWEIITPGCKSASKSPTGSNANPCSTTLTSKVNEVDSFTPDAEANAPEAYPNPATDYLTLFVGNMAGPSVKVTVFDEVGRQLMSREYPVEEGQSEVYMDISALKEGILTIVTENQGTRSAFRIIKQ